MVKKIKTIWTTKATSDLKTIYETHSDKEYIRKAISTLIKNSKQIVFTEQYQEDEILGLPYRRFFYKHWKVIYKPKNNIIQVFRVFDTRLNPNN